MKMKTAIIIHGWSSKEEYFDPKIPSSSNKHWLPWLQKQLILKGILAQTPELPEPYDLVYEKWCSIFERFEITPETMLIGHSAGAGFLVRWLSENKVKVGRVVLVAPFLDPERVITTRFFDFEMDEDMASRTDGLSVFFSSDDEESVLTSVKQLRAELKNLQVKEFVDKGHFTFDDMKTEEFSFPELRDVLLQK
jgi:hypothetical protein